MMDRPNVGTTECCRVCIQPSQGMMPIFSSFSLASKLMWVCQLKICEGDGLPSQICYSCNLRLNDAFQFKELCLTSDVQLRKYGVVEDVNAPARSNTDNGHDLNGSQADEPTDDSQARSSPSSDDVRHHPIEVKVEIQDGNRANNEPSEMEAMEGGVGEEYFPDVGKENAAKKHHHNGVSKTYSCEICAVSFKKKTSFISHMRLHMTDEIDEVAEGVGGREGTYAPPVDQNPFMCSICGGSYKFRESFVAHIKLHDSKGDCTIPKSGDVASYSCAICHASFKIRQGFIAHVRQYHGRENKFRPALPPVKTERPGYSCGVCGRRFDRRAEFASHLAEHATSETEPEKEFTCAICDAVYKHRQGFVAHIRLHTVERRFECADCRKRFASHSDLARHRRCHTGEKPFRCAVCDKRFARQDHLAKHTRTHTGYRPYTCGECDLSFAEKKTLASHLRSHRGEKPYACPVCGKLFARQMNYAAHLRSHAGTRLYECAHCDKAFLEKRGLSRHVSVRHGDGGEAGGS